ncbi:MAG: phosphate signaling complex protein PhoU [bacterium]|nr:phosphate signaling complex protein PhoU [bacterium]
MPQHLQREIEKLKRNILSLSTIVEESVQKAVRSIEQRDTKLAMSVIENDLKIDQIEVDVEEECLKVLALYQPVAIDLRFIVAVLKINNDLERIGDLAVNIAERATFLATQPKVDIPFDLAGMAEKAQLMLRRSLDALVNMDSQLAREVCASDDEVDALNRDMYAYVQAGITRHPEEVECLIHLLSVSRHLERIADHATNIAEDVIYMVDGEISRHKTDEYKPQTGKSS